MTSKVKIVKKGTKEFKEAKEKFLSLFTTDNPKETIVAGAIGMKTLQIDKLKEIPMPFGCPDLELYVWSPKESKDGKWYVAYFCSRVGCLCAPAREDMEGEYPSYCPDPNEIYMSEEEYEDFLF